ncbi:MAG: SDR family oxidoreductase [Verrucomicrobiales bacterium]|nr:SDR family oxidoreductase [Verrucomicrobiales bacterium]
MAAKCWRVAIADINQEAGPEVIRELQTKGVEAFFVSVDVGSRHGPAEMVERIVERFGRLDVLVNCAAHAAVESFRAMTAENWERTLNVNVRGIALAMAAAGEQMKKQKGGRIINISSPASRMALPNYAAYAASKAAVDSITRAAAVALAPFNIQVNSVAPGMMDTPLQLRTEEIFAQLEGCADMVEFRAERTARIPVGRRTDCSEVAQAIVWLATEAPSYVVAERFNISGGLDRD